MTYVPATTSTGGNDTEVQYNDGGELNGIPDLTFDGTNITSLTDIDDFIQFENQGFIPETDGRIGLYQSDIWAQTGNQSKNLSNINEPAGSDGQIQYNDTGDFAAIGDLTYDGTNLTSFTSLDTTLTLLDQASDPTANGEIQRNGSDVKVYSGGSVKNISNIGGSTGGVSESRIQMYSRRQ